MIHFRKNIIVANKHNGLIFMYFIYSSFHPPKKKKKKKLSLLPSKIKPFKLANNHMTLKIRRSIFFFFLIANE